MTSLNASKPVNELRKDYYKDRYLNRSMADDASSGMAAVVSGFNEK